MNSHDVDPAYLNKLYSFWSNLFFGEDDKTKSATGSKKTAEESKPAETKPEGPSASASSYTENLKTNAGAVGFNPGAAIYFGNSQESLAKYSMHFKVINFAATFLAGFLNLSRGQSTPVADPPTYTNYAMGCNYESIPPENIELRHGPVKNRSTSECIHVKKNRSAQKAKAPEKPECRAAYIPFEAIEYRYGNANGIMHLPICMSK
jgi:hypothetical protein